MEIVKTSELKRALDVLIRHLEEGGVQEIELEEDYYWDVPAANRYDQYEEPKEHTIGQLSDDLGEVRKMIAGTTPTVRYGLVWLASILRRVGEMPE